jgi:UDPglucose--hexose-1-phosphate uridylyltransferase
MKWFQEVPHRRYNALTGEWILVSPHRVERPWRGRKETVPPLERPAYDPDCYLCPGNRRAGGERNPSYSGTFSFTNDFAALLPEVQVDAGSSHPLLRCEGVRGTCRVLCFSPRHDLTLAEMSPHEIEAVVNLWIRETVLLGRQYRWVQLFENKGEIMGCSNAHPHGQIWAGSALPAEPAKEDASQRDYFRVKGTPLLLDYLVQELTLSERLILENEHWVALVPFWAVWPFESLLVPKRHLSRFDALLPDELPSLAGLLKTLLTKYDNLFETSFPYTMGWHGAPFDPDEQGHWQLHAHFLPPLLRSSSVKKFMVGYEMLAEPQRDITPERAAGRLRSVPDLHYRTVPRLQ